MAALLTSAELRARAGAALRDARLAGSVEDGVYDQIVREGTEAFVAGAVALARERFLSGGSLLVGDPHALPCRPSGHSAGLYRADIPGDFVPFAFAVEGPDGRAAAYDDDLTRHLFSPWSPRYFRVSGRAVEAVMPGQPRALTVYLATVDAVTDVVGGEVVADANEKMVRAAERALRSRRQEHGDQERGHPVPAPSPRPSPAADGPAA